MTKELLSISQGQHLTDILNMIAPNTILCKTLTGLGATYSEIKAPRNSIIVEPNLPAIIGKCTRHKEDNLFGVKQGVTEDDIAAYLEETIRLRRSIKIIVTPESYPKVKAAFSAIDEDIYSSCFLLLDECHKLIKDRDYRTDILIPMDEFFRFLEKAIVSATPIIPSDPRFEENKFSIVEIKPDFDYRQDVQLVHTNNMLEAVRNVLPFMLKEQECRRSICLFVNRTDLIKQLIDKLDIADRSSVFCSEKSVTKLKGLNFKNAYDQWENKHKRQFNFFTSRYYSAFDIELDEKPDVVFITEPYLADYTIVDPFTDVVQAVGRFRNGVSSVTHFITTNPDIQQRTREGVNEFIGGLEKAYTIISTMIMASKSREETKAYNSVLEMMPYNDFMRNGGKDYFAIDNYVDDELVKSSYRSIEALKDRYSASGYFNICSVDEINYPYGAYERLSLFDASGNLRSDKAALVDFLDNIKDGVGTEMVDGVVAELREKDPDLVDAFFAFGKEALERCKYRNKAIREMLIMKKYEEGKSGAAFIEALRNSFQIGLKYKESNVKAELKRLYENFGVRPSKGITSKTIKEYFEVKEGVRINNSRAILILSSKI